MAPSNQGTNMDWLDIKFKVRWWLNGSPPGKSFKWGRIGEIAAISLFSWMFVSVIGIMLVGFSFITVIPAAIVAIAWSTWGTSTVLFVVSWFILLSS